MQLKFKSKNGIDDKLNRADEIRIGDDATTVTTIEKKIISKPKISDSSSSILEKLSKPTKTYKRVGLDIVAEIDEEIEDIANNILKDKASKKEIYNEALALGFPMWKERLKFIKNNP